MMDDFSDVTQWRLQECRNECGRVRIQYGSESLLKTLQIAKKVLPELLGETTTESLKRFRSGKEGLYLSEQYPMDDVGEFVVRLEEQGVEVELVDESSIGYLIFTADGAGAMLIEDDEEAKRIAQDLIRRGVRVDKA